LKNCSRRRTTLLEDQNLQPSSIRAQSSAISELTARQYQSSQPSNIRAHSSAISRSLKGQSEPRHFKLQKVIPLLSLLELTGFKTHKSLNHQLPSKTGLSISF
jgi:hypothetical protein